VTGSPPAVLDRKPEERKGNTRIMLQELRIKNLALLESLHLRFPERQHGLVVFTGETGAGKSIILQAIHLLTGGRGSAEWIRSGADQAEVEALFLPRSDAGDVKRVLSGAGLEADGECLVRRVLNRGGRSRIYINDRLVTSRLVSELSENLVNIASQHDHQQLLRPGSHLDYLDLFGELMEQRRTFTGLFRKWQKLSSRLRELREREQEKEQRRDFLQYQLEEIAQVDPRVGEDEELRRERERLKSSAILSELAAESSRLLNDAVMAPLAQIRKNMEQAAALDPEVRELAERIVSSSYEMEDLADGLRRYHETVPRDHRRLESINERLAQLRQLQRKYGTTLEEVLEWAARARRELEGLADLEDEIDALELELEEVSTRALLAATELSEARRQAAGKLSALMEKELSSLNFPQADFQVSLSDPEGMGMDGIQATGRDQVEFLFSANPGEPVKPLAQVVSGGELSRLMLAMKCVLARRDQVETVIFDEVDAGISGQAAEAVAVKIAELAGHHQVLCITHLPQIAARAHTHYRVEKQVRQDRTVTSISLLDREERIHELARMLGGENPSNQTLALAREMIDTGQEEQ